MPVTARYVFDTSAVMAVLNAEPEAATVATLVAQADRSEVDIALPFLVLMEVEYLLLRYRPRSEVESYVARLAEWPATIMESFETWRRTAARVKAAGNISVVDAWVAALGLLTGAEVIHRDPQFEKVSGLRQRNLRPEKGAGDA